MEEEYKSFYPKTKAAWRAWLKKNHKKETSIWIIYYKKNSGLPCVKYSKSVDEALCFGWIDSKAKTIDEFTYRQFFAKRKLNSVWSKVNKAKIENLISNGLMTPARLECIEAVRLNGSWTILDEVEELIVPPDLQAKFKRSKKASDFFETLSRTDKRNILQWLVLAKRDETRQKWLDEIVSLAKVQKKPKQF